MKSQAHNPFACTNSHKRKKNEFGYDTESEDEDVEMGVKRKQKYKEKKNTPRRGVVNPPVFFYDLNKTYDQKSYEFDSEAFYRDNAPRKPSPTHTNETTFNNASGLNNHEPIEVDDEPPPPVDEIKFITVEPSEANQHNLTQPTLQSAIELLRDRYYVSNNEKVIIDKTVSIEELHVAYNELLKILKPSNRPLYFQQTTPQANEPIQQPPQQRTQQSTQPPQQQPSQQPQKQQPSQPQQKEAPTPPNKKQQNHTIQEQPNTSYHNHGVRETNDRNLEAQRLKQILNNKKEELEDVTSKYNDKMLELKQLKSSMKDHEHYKPTYKDIDHYTMEYQKAVIHIFGRVLDPTESELNSAYRAALKKTHPDSNSSRNALEESKRLNASRDIVKSVLAHGIKEHIKIKVDPTYYNYKKTAREMMSEQERYYNLMLECKKELVDISEQIKKNIV